MHHSFLQSLLRLFAVLGVVLPGFATEPFLRPHDVIAFIGGEDMVAMSEYGFLELLLVRALPDHQLRFRNLAWEGDTVFEQRRDLNFPPLEAQLNKIGATVVIAQFGQMESLAGKEKLPEFRAAYEQLIARISGGGKRRVIVLAPGNFESVGAQASRDLYAEAIRTMSLQPGGLMDISPGQRPGLSVNKAAHPGGAQDSPAPAGADAVVNIEPRVSPGANIRQPSGLKTSYRFSRDGVHLSTDGHLELALGVQETMQVADSGGELGYSQTDGSVRRRLEPLSQLILAKNRLWFHYWRPQNWAFLNGDRINQPSSRDHLDPSKRWFPEEIEQFIPLIEAKEREIDTLATKLSKP